MWAVKSYELPLDKEFSLDLPDGAKLLEVDLRQKEPKIFAQVSLSTPTHQRNFRLFRTGEVFPSDKLHYVKSFHKEATYHLFEIKS